MKKSLLLCLSVFFLYSCSKSDTGSTDGTAYNLITLNGMIIQDGTVLDTISDAATYNQIKSMTFYFSEFGPGRTGDTIQCSLTGLPPGATATPSSGIVALPNTWSSTLVMNADPGLYKIALTVVSANGTHVYPINMSVVTK